MCDPERCNLQRLRRRYCVKPVVPQQVRVAVWLCRERDGEVAERLNAFDEYDVILFDVWRCLRTALQPLLTMQIIAWLLVTDNGFATPCFAANRIAASRTQKARTTSASSGVD